MDPLLLILAGLAILLLLGVGGALLVVRRLDALERSLLRLDELPDLTRRVQRLSAELDRKELSSQIQSKLTEVGEAERRLGAAVSELQQQVAELAGRVEGALHDAARPPETTATGATEIALRHLRAKGFSSIRVLSDLSRVEGSSGRVVFEAFRSGAMHKGHVELREGVIEDETIRAAYSAFP